MTSDVCPSRQAATLPARPLVICDVNQSGEFTSKSLRHFHSDKLCRLDAEAPALSEISFRAFTGVRFSPFQRLQALEAPEPSLKSLH